MEQSWRRVQNPGVQEKSGSIEITIHLKMLQQKVSLAHSAFIKFFYTGKNSPVFWNEVVCVWKEEEIRAHLLKARKKMQHFGNIF